MGGDRKCHTLPPEISYYWNVEEEGVEENELHNDETGEPAYFCGFPDKATLFENPKGVWRVKQLGCKASPDYCAERRFEDMYILQSTVPETLTTTENLTSVTPSACTSPSTVETSTRRTPTRGVCHLRPPATRRAGAGDRTSAPSPVTMRTTAVASACGRTLARRTRRSLR